MVSSILCGPIGGNRLKSKKSEEQSSLPQRLVELEGAYNFRDLGGYPTQDNQHSVKWGKIYRSSHLSSLTDGDLKKVSQLGIKAVCDFRGDQEMKQAPDRYPPKDDTSFLYKHLPILHKKADPYILWPRMQAKDMLEPEAIELLPMAYGLFVTDFSYQFREMFQLLAQKKNQPFLFHCSQGKDRTGIAAALILLALGVSEENVIQDYMLTDLYNAEYVKVRQSKSPVPLVQRHLLNVRPLYLQKAFQAMKEKCGSIEGYLVDALGLNESTRAHLRETFLEKR